MRKTWQNHKLVSSTDCGGEVCLSEGWKTDDHSNSADVADTELA